MITRKFVKTMTAGAALAALVVFGLLIVQPSGGAASDAGSQDEQQMIQIGMKVAPVPLNTVGKDPDLVGLGSYLVNVTSDCNGCHTKDNSSEFLPTGNPYLLMPPHGPFTGIKQTNAATYLGGGNDFGEFPSPGGAVHIISRNLTPDKSGRAEGGRTLSEFMHIIRTGVDLDKDHPNCPTNTPNCLLPPFNGALLQVMPWSGYQNMTDRQLTAIYTYLSSIPCLEGGPGEPPSRCK